MIVVTGTMRSGTSMWMQVLQAAGAPIIGTDFPGQWKRYIGEANSKGFYESILRDGIYYRTNPHPQTGTYLHPDRTRGHAVKVFAQGLVRSDVSFLTRVLLSVRPVREYVASITRLMEMERVAKTKDEGREVELPPHIPHALRWWDDNFSAFRDAMIRGYPTHAMAYDTVFDDSEAVARTLRWLGVPDVEAGLACVDAQLRTQQRPAQAETSASKDVALDVQPEVVEVFDELYERVRTSVGFDEAFTARLNEIDALLEPRIKDAQRLAKQQTSIRVKSALEATRAASLRHR